MRPESDALAAYARFRSTRTRVQMPWLRAKALARGERGRIRLAEGLGRIEPGCDCASAGRRHLALYCHNIGEVRTALPFVREVLAVVGPGLGAVCLVKSVVARAAAAELMPEACGVFYAPLDDTRCVTRALEALSPCCCLCILEGDVRPTMVEAARGLGIPVAFINGGLSPVEMARHRGHAAGQRAMLETMALLALKGPVEADTAERLGVSGDRIFISGNCRYDIGGTSMELPPGPLADTLNRARVDGRRIIVAGSTYRPEERALARALPELVGEFPDLLMVVAPRNIGRADQVVEAFEGSAVAIAKRTELTLLHERDALQVLVVDTMGELVGAYGHGDVCFVGGSLVPKGGHNIIEAAAHGVPVVFGPSLFNNADIAARLLELDGGVQVDTEDALGPCLRAILGDDLRRERMGAAAGRAVAENAGAVRRTVDRLLPLLGLSVEGDADA